MPSTGRQVVYGRNMVATNVPVAAQAGIQMMRDGGNAVDAAVATAACMSVVEPTTNGIGADMFAILNEGEKLVGLNASGKSPAGWTPDRFAGRRAMPQSGWDCVTVPGAPSGWAALHEQYGKLPFEKVMAPAVHYARQGFPVSPIIASYWRNAERRWGDFEEFRRVFLPAPRAGDVFKSEDQARTIEEIARTKAESFYRGALAKKIAAASQSDGGAMTEEDLAEHQPVWHTEEELASAEAFGVTLFEIPPNGQGIAACMAWRICHELATHLASPKDFYTADGVHLQIEAMKLAFADVYAYVSDPATMPFDQKRLTDSGYLAERAKLIDPKEARVFAAGVPTQGGTINLTTADESGMMVSLIQSNYGGFGSGVVVPGTGIALQNRGACFVLTEGHPNQVGPRKRPFHTIIPGFAKRDGKPLLAFQLMGGPMQPQGHLQMMLRIFAAEMGLQAAVEAPRWQVMQGHEVTHEAEWEPAIIEDLKRRGHILERAGFVSFGGAQMIRRLGSGIFEGASDNRKDGHAVAY